MDFSLTEEQAMLADSVSRFIDNEYSFEKRTAIAAGESPFSDEVWATFVDLGWTAMLFDEEDGGFGGGPIELMLIMEQFGRGLVLEPFVPNIVLAGGVLKRAGNVVQKSRWLSGIVEGTRHGALAFAEPQARFDIAHVVTRGQQVDSGWRLDGKKTFVLNGGNADVLVVPARTAGGPSDERGITLFAVDAGAHGVTKMPYKTVDALGAAEIELADVRVESDAVLGEVDGGYEILQQSVHDGLLAVSAEAVGIIRAMHDKTVDYSKQRVQFGVPIGSFQALQHRMVDTLMACELCRSLLLRAAMLLSDGAADAGEALAELKYLIGTAGRKVAQEAVQLHGGMGVTWELDIAHFFKRFSAIEVMFGNADYHLDRLAGLR